MAFTDSFRKQHQDILQIAGQIAEKLQPEQIGKDPKPVRTLLSNLAGKINLHLAMEDKALYPRLIAVKDAESGVLARKYMDEMGGLAQVFTTYNGKWQASAMSADPAGFCRETQTVFAALGKRIEREDNHLYPLVDKVKS